MAWDKEAVYDEEISPLMAQIIAICKRESIPMACRFQFADLDDEGPQFCTTLLPFRGVEHEVMTDLNGYMDSQINGHALAVTETTDAAGNVNISVRSIG